MSSISYRYEQQNRAMKSGTKNTPSTSNQFSNPEDVLQALKRSSLPVEEQ